jgi:UDP-N-acetylmuramoyl-tripeptide--D-alanyl-D-alanine ligase
VSARWTSAFVQRALELDAAPEGPGFTAISTDTRTLERGALFVALAGERFDAHDHLADARTRNAAAAVVRRGTAPVPGLPLIEVEDPLQAYGRLARARRREIRGPVIAVTGTNGKTSTKEMLRAVLGTRFSVHATRANLNNLVGVPLTILESPTGTDALVVEAGANLPGEIARYREIIVPTIAVVTNVGSGHLEGFGSLAGVMREKLSLVADVPLAIVGTDPPELAEQARPLARRVLTAGLTAAERKARDVELDELGRASFSASGHRITLPFPGKHLAANAMLAWTVAEELGLDLAAVARALSAFTLPGGRSEVVSAGGLTILNDCYNANPQSFQSAIATARAMRHGRRLVFVAGTMRELGPESSRLHAEVAEQLVLLKPDLLAVVGDFAAPLSERAGELGDRLLTAPDPLTLGPALAARLQGDEIVVLKASRGVALERILPYLTTGRTPPTEA